MVVNWPNWVNSQFIIVCHCRPCLTLVSKEIQWCSFSWVHVRVIVCRSPCSACRGSSDTGTLSGIKLTNVRKSNRKSNFYSVVVLHLSSSQGRGQIARSYSKETVDLTTNQDIQSSNMLNLSSEILVC